MAYTTHNTRTFGSATIWQRLAELRANAAEHSAKYRLHRATLNELASLSDRDLADIGIGRGEIEDIAYKAAYAN